MLIERTRKDEEVKIMSNMKAEKMTEPEVVVTHEKKVAKTTSTGIKSCKCKSDFQDKIYGKGMRAKNSTNSGFRCTVCRSTT